MTNVIDENNSLVLDSNFVEVYGAKMHYLSTGKGDPILFLHGMPTSSYLWRNIMPGLSSEGACYAPDMIGMGRSEKMDIAYTIDDHIKYLNGFIRSLNLKNITLVLHAWGSILGFEYARLHPENIKGIAFYESHIKIAEADSEVSLPISEFVAMLKYQDNIYKKVVDDNFLLNNFLNAGMINSLSEADLAEYNRPFLEPKDRMVLLQYVNELPFGRKANRVNDIIDIYSSFLQETKIPKLLLFAIPGFSTSVGTINWAKENLPNLSLYDLGDGLHFIQESNPKSFVDGLRNWIQEI